MNALLIVNINVYHQIADVYEFKICALAGLEPALPVVLTLQNILSNTTTSVMERLSAILPALVPLYKTIVSLLALEVCANFTTVHIKNFKQKIDGVLLRQRDASALPVKGCLTQDLIFTYPLTIATQLKFGRIGTCNSRLAMNSCPTMSCFSADNAHI